MNAIRSVVVIFVMLTNSVGAEELVVKLKLIDLGSRNYVFANSTNSWALVGRAPLAYFASPPENLRAKLVEEKSAETFKVYTTAEVYNMEQVDALVAKSVNMAEENITRKLSEITPNFYITLRAEMMESIREELKNEVKNELLGELCVAFEEEKKPEACG